MTAVGKQTVISPPQPGVAVLACRCGRALDLADMRRYRWSWRRTRGSAPTVDRITCARCSVR